MIGLFLNLLDTQTEKDKFQLLYNTYCDLLYWIALKRTNRVEDAEECVQETFLYIAKHFDKIGEINSKKTKIYLSTDMRKKEMDFHISVDFFLTNWSNDCRLKTTSLQVLDRGGNNGRIKIRGSRIAVCGNHMEQ